MKFNELNYQFYNKPKEDGKVYVRVKVSGTDGDDVRKVLDKINIDDWTDDSRKYILIRKELNIDDCEVVFSLQ